MSEHLTPNPLETEMLGDRSLQGWHTWLTTSETGEPTGHLAAPGSRYGSDGAECAWYAIALEAVYIHANGQSDNPEGTMDHCMGLCINNSDWPETLLRENWDFVPGALKEVIGDNMVSRGPDHV